MQRCRSVIDPGSANPRTTDLRIWILLFSSVTIKKPANNKFYFKFFCLLIFESTFTSFFEGKKS
jgi:hypothetical protein